MKYIMSFNAQQKTFVMNNSVIEFFSKIEFCRSRIGSIKVSREAEKTRNHRHFAVWCFLLAFYWVTTNPTHINKPLFKATIRKISWYSTSFNKAVIVKIVIDSKNSSFRCMKQLSTSSIFSHLLGAHNHKGHSSCATFWLLWRKRCRDYGLPMSWLWFIF